VAVQQGATRYEIATSDAALHHGGRPSWQALAAWPVAHAPAGRPSRPLLKAVAPGSLTLPCPLRVRDRASAVAGTPLQPPTVAAAAAPPPRRPVQQARVPPPAPPPTHPAGATRRAGPVRRPPARTGGVACPAPAGRPRTRRGAGGGRPRCQDAPPHSTPAAGARLGHTRAPVALAARRCRRGRERVGPSPPTVGDPRCAGWPGHGPPPSTSPTFCHPAVGT